MNFQQLFEQLPLYLNKPIQVDGILLRESRNKIKLFYLVPARNEMADIQTGLMLHLEEKLFRDLVLNFRRRPDVDQFWGDHVQVTGTLIRDDESATQFGLGDIKSVIIHDYVKPLYTFYLEAKIAFTRLDMLPIELTPIEAVLEQPRDFLGRTVRLKGFMTGGDDLLWIVPRNYKLFTNEAEELASSILVTNEEMIGTIIQRRYGGQGSRMFWEEIEVTGEIRVASTSEFPIAIHLHEIAIRCNQQCINHWNLRGR
jgi:hypothetical protein